MLIKFKKLSQTAIAPNKSHYNDSGFDLYADEDVVLAYGETRVIATNIALELPDGFMADVRPRSGLTSKTALRVHYGTVDAGYRGGIGIICENAIYNKTPAYVEMVNKIDHSETIEEVMSNTNDCIEFIESLFYKIKKGDKIAQLVIQRIPDITLIEASELNDTVRGAGGFGSTGK